MVSKNSRTNQLLLYIAGAIFLCVTLYSAEIIAALGKSNLLSINLEQIKDDDRIKNSEILARQRFEEVSSNLQNAKQILSKSNERLAKLEISRDDLRAEKLKLKDDIEKLKFDLVDQQNKKKLAESNTGRINAELKTLKSENEGLKNKISSLDKVALEKARLEKLLNGLEEKNRKLLDQS